MIGLSRTLRASSATRSLPAHSRAVLPRTGLAVALSAAGVALALTGCESALSDGTPSMDPFGPGNSNVNNPNGVGNPSNPNNPNSPTLSGMPGPGEPRNPSLTIQSSGPTVDENGAPLPAEMLADLEQCATPGPRQIRRLTS